MASEREINVLIFGGRGSGKSTFIKMLEIVELYPPPKDAKTFNLISGELVKCTQNSVNLYETYDFQQDRSICKPKVFEWRTKYGILRLIETPSLENNESFNTDYENFERLTSFAETFKKIHAVILVLKMNNDNLNIHTRQHLSQVLLCLGKNAAKKVIIVFTHTEQVTSPQRIAKQLLNSMQNFESQINFSEEMCFCLANGSLKRLIERNAKAHFLRSELVHFSECYKKMVREYVRLICKLFECTQPYSCTSIQVIHQGKKLCPLVNQLTNVLEDEAYFIQGMVNQKRKAIDDIDSEINSVIPEVQRTQTHLGIVRQSPKYANNTLEENTDLQTQRNSEKNMHSNEPIPREAYSTERPPVVTFARSISRGAVTGAFKGAVQAGFYGAFVGAFQGAAFGAGLGSVDILSSVLYKKLFTRIGHNAQAIQPPTNLTWSSAELVEDEAICPASQQNSRKRLEELQQKWLTEEKQLETLRETYEELNSELELLTNFKKDFNTFLCSFCTTEVLEDECSKDSEANDEHVTSAEDLSQRIDELCKLKHVGSSVAQVVVECHTFNTAGFEAIEMKCGYLFDRVVQRYALMARLALNGQKDST